MVAQGAGDDLGSRCRSTVDQHDQRLAPGDVAAARGEALGFLRRAAAGRDHLAPRHEAARHRDRLVEQSARIIAEVDDKACEFLRRNFLRDFADRLAQSIGGLLVEAGDPDIADVAAIGVVADRAHPNDLAHDREIDRLVQALANDLDAYLAVGRPLHLAHGLFEGQPLNGILVDLRD